MNKLINGKFLALKFCNKLYYWLLVDFNLEEGRRELSYFIVAPKKKTTLELLSRWFRIIFYNRILEKWDGQIGTRVE